MRQIFLLVFASANLFAFSLLGPYEPWQTAELGFFRHLGDRGGPKNLHDEYRWNVPVITYGFDPAFLEFFGQQGAAEIDAALDILNRVPPASEIDPAQYQGNSPRFNVKAHALKLLDLKSAALSLMLERMGLAQSERWVWTLRSRTVTTAIPPAFPGATNYWVVQRNFDPYSWEPTPFVNGTRYTYLAAEFRVPGGTRAADALEIPVDPEFAYSSVAGRARTLDTSGWPAGVYVSQLTPDDAGGIRYLLHPANLNFEPTLTNVLQNGSANAVGDVLRPGINKVTFRRVDPAWYTTPGWSHTNHFSDRYYEGITLAERPSQRVITRPDIVFSAADAEYNWSHYRISGPGFRQAEMNREAAGPGILEPGTLVQFARLGSAKDNRFPGSTTEETASDYYSVYWGSFGHSTNAPVVYPIGASLTRGTLSATLARTNGVETLQGTFHGAPHTVYELQQSTNLRQWGTIRTFSNALGRHEFTIERTLPASLLRVHKPVQ